MPDLPVVQKTFDLIKWYLPILNRLAKPYKFGLGDRMTHILYDLLENLIIARYSQNKISILESLNAKVDILRHQTRLLLELSLIKESNYEHASKLIHEIGSEIGGWLKQQKNKKYETREIYR